MTDILIENGRVIDPSQSLDQVCNIVIEGDKIHSVTSDTPACKMVIDASGKVVTPGLIDMHVHLREPGREDKEDLYHGLLAAMSGGFTTVCTMANTERTIDNEASVSFIKYKAQSLKLSKAEPICAVTRGLQGKELTDFYLCSKAGAVAFSDDGKPIMDSNIMLKALQYAKLIGKRIISHAEDHNLSRSSVMNEGKVSLLTGLKGAPSVAEDTMVIRDILLADYAKSKVHIAHTSTARAIELIRWGKERGIDVTCEVAPHHLVFTENQVASYDAKFKVNPPLRTKEDIAALVEAINDGIVDAIASDHAPHTIDEKEDEIHGAPVGIAGLETTVGVMLTYLVHAKKIRLEKVIELLSCGPARVLGFSDRGTLKKGSAADITIIDPEEEWIVNTSDFKSKCRVSPYNSHKLKGKVVSTIVNGEIRKNLLGARVNNDEDINEEIHLNDWS